ncbi:MULTISPECIES: hypothetical protein [Mameliella]|uniref:hypothetical protein n=1 Tax=Mameliella TaxID=1434019 RepID=UPI001056A34C|nr:MULTISPECIES: hypothetical protein [Mameliella]MCR9275780.1 hypothetical protein [Paracoccaceae bacterium]
MTIRNLFPSMRAVSARLSSRPAVPVGTSVAPTPAPRHAPVDIPICDPGPDALACETLRARGQFLARQDDWEQLAKEIATAEAARQQTPGLRSAASMLAEGARRDMTTAIAEAVARGKPREVQAAVAALEPLLAEMPACPVIAQIIAMVHVETARAWRAAPDTGLPASDRQAAFARHMAAATRLNDRFDPFEHQSPLWAVVRCAVLEADPAPQDRVADDFEDLIDLDPGNPWHMWQFGKALRPARFGSWEQLDAQARRTAARTGDLWGSGGYAWIYLGALCEEAGAFARLDAELFVEGLHDILTRHPTQDMANRMAALVGHTLGGPTRAGSTRRRVADCLGWIAQDHLRELHPQVWAEAPERSPGARLDCSAAKPGEVRALDCLTEFYAPALEAGRRLRFGPDGMRMIKGD